MTQASRAGEAGEPGAAACLAYDSAPRCETDQPERWPDVVRWRQAERKRLISERLAVGVEERKRKAQRIASLLDLAISRFSGRVVGVYWPVQGEPDLRDWTIRVVERGGRIALPVVIQKGWPLEYRIWSPGDLLENGIGNIPSPARGPAVQPDIVVAPVVGFDEDHHRLGYGGGFFDRTLAAMRRKPVAIGVGYAEARMPTIHPQPHDIAMDVVLTD
ncbi:MAG: 5-formyltetrahydrofolate cyclo-ligase [Mesorhizobium sp.]|nr:5-formyltetrahydrofolate cyclo-ligase [Mesorhizobium sp.]MBN9242153.1 5-formyltetrahydrofolate cyclo-ligase [Mesorhizobium sp.]